MSTSKSKVDSRKKKDRSAGRNDCKKVLKNIAWRLFTHITVIIHILKNKLTEIFLQWYWGERKYCPPLTDNLFITKSAVDIAHMIRYKEITSYEVVKAYIERIKIINPVINAVMDGPFNEALNEAMHVDERISNTQISDEEYLEKPFLGVPFTTKDSTAVKGKLYTLGIVARKNVTANEDAECVKLIKEAGGIIIATSSIPEINRWVETRNNIIGQTRNPYDTRRTVGGSSGGEGALISSCATAFGIGTDIGGSIRIPAFYCGIFGHKPTVGLVNTRGCTLRTGKEPSTMVVVGPMTRYAKDLLPIFKVLVGPKNVISLKLNEQVDITKLKYYYIKHTGEIRSSPVASDMQSAMTRVINHFTGIGFEAPQCTRLPGTESTFKMFKYWMDQEPQNFNTMLGNGVKLNPIVELGKKIIGRSEYTMAAIYSLLFGLIPTLSADKIKELTRKCDEELTNLLGDDGILFYHTTPYTATFHYAQLIDIFNFSHTSLFNVLHVPSTQVPLGLNSEGLPLGIQIVATRNRDRHCIAVAHELERAFGGWVPPFINK